MIDTRNKRFSMLSMSRAFAPTLPEPDSTIVQADRQQFAYLYTGILADPPSAAVYDTAKYTIVGLSRNVTVQAESRNLIIQGATRNTTIQADGRSTEIV